VNWSSDWTRASLIVSWVVISSGLTVGFAIKSAPPNPPSSEAASQIEFTPSAPLSPSSDPADQPERTTSAPVDRSPILPINLPDPLVTSALPSLSSAPTKGAEAAEKKGASSASPRHAHPVPRLHTAGPDLRYHPAPPIRPAFKTDQAVASSKDTVRGPGTRKRI
jgi:hypothetical protein